MVSKPDRRRSLTLFGSFVAGLLTIPSLGAAERPTGSTTPETDDRAVYVAVVDRIVDGAHVVLLLEEDDQIVDELVVPREEMPDVEETDTLQVLVEDDELLEYRHLPDE